MTVVSRGMGQVVTPTSLGTAAITLLVIGLVANLIFNKGKLKW